MSKQHTTDNARALVALALDTSEPADCIKSIRRLFSLGGGAKPKVEAWQPTALQVAAYEKINAERVEMMADDRNLLSVFFGWRHSAELRESQEMTGISLCRYCHVPAEQKRVDMSVGDNELVVTVEAVAVQVKPVVEQICVCGHLKTVHYANGTAQCYLCDQANDGRRACDMFTSVEAAEAAKADARKLLPAVNPRR